MHGVNLDLLRTGPHHPDGRAKDLYARHRLDHLAALKAARSAGRAARLHWVKARLARVLSRFRKPEVGSVAPIFCQEVSHRGPGV